MSSTTDAAPPTAESLLSQYKIQTPPSALNPQPGVQLSAPQQLILCSVLDLFAGHPSKRNLTLWADDASFHDPLTNATGRKQFEAQWYGLKAAFAQIERQECRVRSAGPPAMEMALTTRYKVAGLGSEQTISSVVAVETAEREGGLCVTKVEDRWDGEIKEGPVRKALRGLNSVAVPGMVKVPNSVEEEESQKT